MESVTGRFHIPVSFLYLVLSVFLCTVTQGRIKDFLTDSQTFRSYFQILIRINIFQSLFQT